MTVCLRYLELYLCGKVYGAALSLARNVARDGAVATGSESEFHSGMVRWKKEFLTVSDLALKCLYVWGWLERVLWSDGMRKLSPWIATSPWMILNSRASRSSRRRSCRECHFRSFRRLVTLALGSCSWATKRAARRCTISSLLESLLRCGSQTVQQYSSLDLIRVM